MAVCDKHHHCFSRRCLGWTLPLRTILLDFPAHLSKLQNVLAAFTAHCRRGSLPLRSRNWHKRPAEKRSVMQLTSNGEPTH